VPSEPKFRDRTDAGRELAQHLQQFAGRENVLVLALPRGGVPVAYEVARELDAPLDVFIVRKLGVPGQEELAFGALASGGVTVFNEGIVRSLGMSEALVQQVIEREQLELERREKLYRDDRPPHDLTNKIVIVVDDGLATGATMAATAKALQQMGPKEVVAAVPVSSTRACEKFYELTNAQCISAETPEPFYGVGMWYEKFDQTTDEEVQDLLSRQIDSLKSLAKGNTS
jgi:putative phosphoribosyl transferase